MTVLIQDETDAVFDFDVRDNAIMAVNTVVKEELCPYDVSVDITIVSKEDIREINNEHRNIDKVTDVLSFPLNQYSYPADFNSELFENNKTISPDSNELMLGDIVICADVVMEQAEAYGHSQLREFVFLIVHSCLHLLGYDHIEEEDRVLMEDRQRVIMDYMNIYR